MELNHEYDFSHIDFTEFDVYEEGSKQEAIFRAKGAHIQRVAESFIEDAVAMGDSGPTLYELIVHVISSTEHFKGWLPSIAMLQIAEELKGRALADSTADNN